ncbi:hypothetical protein SORBI_3001G036600 [Sorghum bicolor]|uniref:Ubiquitin-like domain-containing protein n=1 Tax=Sorghum bicolor TaxID=4558 RepID=A0A1Z5S465_SORBI|nr:hypothetical protein SORBI_3001G036600 [Sorghum bicolor]
MQAPQQMWIFVSTLTGETIPLEVLGSDTINVVKAKIQDRHRLIYDGKWLDDRHTLDHYEIHSGCSLILDLNRGGMPMPIFIKMMTGRSRTITLDVQNTDTIRTVKAMIYHMDDIPLDQQCLTFDGKQLKDGCSLADNQQRLVYGGRQLQDDHTLADYNILRFCTLDLLLRLRGGQ